jgi:predicted TPR repeat methyltransferase
VSRRGYDIGCGYGDSGRLMSDVVVQQVGADKNQTMVEKARETGIYIEVMPKP